MNALLLVDIQNDFLPGGALAVPEGDAVIPVANRLIDAFHDAGQPVLATQDFHPPDHQSFASQHPGHAVGEVIQLHGLDQVLWPDHCVQHTPGCRLAPSLHTHAIDRVFTKGADREVDSYSGFFDNGRRHDTGLHDHLQRIGVTALTVAGLATDYCVHATVLDARRLGYGVTVVEDAVRGVELHAGDIERRVKEMNDAGAAFAPARDVIAAPG